MRNKKRSIDSLINNNLELPIEVTENFINDFIYKSLTSINKKKEIKPNHTYIVNYENELFSKADNFINSILELLKSDEGTLIDKKDLKLKRSVKKNSVNGYLTIYTIVETLTYNNSITMMLIKHLNSINKEISGELIFDINISDKLGKDNYNKNIYI
ncbi:hypothetical protein [Staphylococcus phage LY01]|nr:hypothetical protein [Staphylococcus phage LY01]